LRRCLDHLAARIGLTDSEFLTIWLCLSGEGGMVQGELAAALGVSPAQMSGIVERLRQRGMIEMHRQTLDRRRQVWRGTASAQQAVGALTPQLAALADRLEAHVTTTDQEAAHSLCQRLAEAASSLPDSDNYARDQSMAHPDQRSTPEAA